MGLLVATHEIDDTGIAAGLRAGDASAAEALVDRFAGPLTRYFRVHLPDPQSAEDMAQEVFVRLMGTLRRGPAADVRSLYALVFTIARNLAIDAQRARGRQPRFEALDADPPEDGAGPVMVQIPARELSPRDLASAHESKQRVEDALRRIAPELREAVVLRHIEGMSGREIAALTGVAQGTVWSRIGRGMHELKALLEGAERGAANSKQFPGGAQ
jgi:RNA polymerase sigma-70 factor (ECF subfamily)